MKKALWDFATFKAIDKKNWRRGTSLQSNNHCQKVPAYLLPVNKYEDNNNKNVANQNNLALPVF